MPGIERLQQVKGVATPDFAQNDAIRPQAQRGFEQVADRDGRYRRLLPPGLQAHEVFRLQLNLGGILDQNDSLVWINEAGKRIEERRFACSCSARNEDIL